MFINNVLSLEERSTTQLEALYKALPRAGSITTEIVDKMNKIQAILTQRRIEKGDSGYVK